MIGWAPKCIGVLVKQRDLYERYWIKCWCNEGKINSTDHFHLSSENWVINSTVESLDASSPLCFMQIRRGELCQNTAVFVSVLLGWRHVSATVGHTQDTKMYNEEKLYSVRSLVVHILNFQRDLVMRVIHIELITCSTSKVDRVKVYVYTLTLSTLLVEHVVCSVWINLVTTRSCWKFRICTTTNDLTLYSFSSLYIFVTWGWPTVAETCRQPNKTGTKTVVLWRTYPLLINCCTV